MKSLNRPGGDTMAEAINRTAKSTQEQAVAAWITHLNQCRLDELIEKLTQQDINFQDALEEMAELKAFIGNPEHILGSVTSKHGEIAEHMQVNISNARKAVEGLVKEYTFDGVGRTAPEDYLKNGQQIQSKFYNSLKATFFNKHALAEHLEKYSDFIANGGSYDIPKDQYNELVRLLELYNDTSKRSQLSKSEFNLIKKINDYLNENNLEVGKDIKPAVVDYNQAQMGVADDTVNEEVKKIKKTDEEQRRKAYDKSKPSIREGAKAAGISATIEGGVSFCLAIAKKRKEKNFSDFTYVDWTEIGIDTGKGAVKGGIRGGVIYALTNFTATPANVASAYVTAAFGIASQIKEHESGKISDEDFIINCEIVCLDVTVSAIASVAGQVMIPVPVLGAVVGNIAGEFVYEFCKKQGASREQNIVEKYVSEMDILNKELEVQLLQVIVQIQSNLKQFKDLEKFAFDEDVNRAFDSSIKLAIEVGVSEEKVLKNIHEVDDYFMG